jgi:hypothetical protein
MASSPFKVCQGPNVFRIGDHGFPDQLHLRIVPLESLIMVLLTRSHLLQAVGYSIENTLDAIKPLVAVGHLNGIPDSRVSSDAPQQG